MQTQRLRMPTHLCNKAHIKVQIPIRPKTPGDVILTRTVSFKVDIDAVAFLDHVCAHMDISPNTAHLGYKWNLERRNDPPRNLSTSRDLAEAFGIFMELSNSRKHKEVIMEVIDLVSSALSHSWCCSCS